jgi:hypothetical protein
MYVGRMAAVATALVLALDLTHLAAQADQRAQQVGRPSATDDLLTAKRRVVVSNEVAGDVAAAGAEIAIRAPVSGYVMGAGRAVTLHGRVGNDVWAAGETVSLDSAIGNNAMVAGRTVRLGRNSVIGHDARLAGNVVTAEGRIERNLDIGAGTARIGADVGGTVHASANEVSVLPGAVIHGDLIVHADQPPDISPQAQVLGEVRYEETEAFEWSWAGRWLYAFLALLVLAMTVVAYAPDRSARVATALRARTGASVLYGLLVLVLLPIAIAALAVTLIGIPLAIVLLAFYIAILALSGVFVSYRVGDWLMTRLHRMQVSIWTRMLLGVLLVSLGISLPAIGIVLTAVVVILGSGAFVVERWSQRADVRTAG